MNCYTFLSRWDQKCMVVATLEGQIDFSLSIACWCLSRIVPHISPCLTCVENLGCMSSGHNNSDISINSRSTIWCMGNLCWKPRGRAATEVDKPTLLSPFDGNVHLLWSGERRTYRVNIVQQSGAPMCVPPTANNRPGALNKKLVRPFV